MRVNFKTIILGMAVAGAALSLSACGSKSTQSDTTNMTELNSVEGTTNDMTAIDSATGEASNMAGDSNMAGMNMSHESTADNATGNAM